MSWAPATSANGTARARRESSRHTSRECRRFWGFLPYKKYVFLLMFRNGGGGLEHKNSTLSDDVMRLAYSQYAGARGFTADEFRATVEEVAGADLKEWFRKGTPSRVAEPTNARLKSLYGATVSVKSEI